MVPQKIMLEGFLCYRTTQEIDLSDLRLCMLAGPNGSGKSAVFDAITFALFGMHRGGSRNAEDLINKKSDSARVTFEFLLDGSPWQIYRTIKRNLRGTRMTGDVRRPSAKGCAGEWEVVPDTSSAGGLANWVASNLALSGEAFTRSMLLRQGESDRLLTAEPRERFSVLAGIAELEKYQELETSANDRRQRTAGEVEKLASQLEAIALVSEAEFEQATADAASAVEHLRAVDEQIASLQACHAQSTHWADLMVKLNQARQKRHDAESLVRNSTRIEEDYRQLTVLETALPCLLKIHEHRQHIDKSNKRIATLTGQRNQNRQSLDVATAQAKLAQETCSSVEPLIPELESHQSALARKVAESRRMLDAADATEKQRISLGEIAVAIDKIVRIHPHPDVELSQARDELGRLTSLSIALPTLQRFTDSRRSGIAAAERRADAEAAKRKSITEIEAVYAERQAVEANAAKADAAQQDAQNSETEAQTLLKHAKSALADLDKAEGKPQCPTCGQPLTKLHLATERQNRQADVDQWTARRADAATARQAAELRVKELRRACSDLNNRQQELAGPIQKFTNTCAQAEQEMTRTARECRQSYLALPEDLRTRVSPEPRDDWAITTWPASEDIDRLTCEAKRRTTAQEQVKELDQICAEWQNLKTRASTLREALSAHVAVPDDLPALRDGHVRLEKEQRDTQNRLTSARETLRREQQTLKRLAEQIKSLEVEISSLGSQCEVELAHQKTYDEAIRQLLAQLPADWLSRTDDLSLESLAALKTQADHLIQIGIKRAFNDLSEARVILATIEARIAELDADISRIPEPARRPPESIALQLQQARADRNSRESLRQKAQSRRAELETARRQRQELEQSRRQADRRLRHLKLLCELLGKKRLQLYLIRQTERKIVECANGILDKLSAGDLRLQLRAGEGDDATDQALDLVAIHRSTGGGQPIAVAFLSGSQRFRVAVSLALAIGQVAGNHRCGECVIIDEGFGSLDSQGETVMIHELERLKGLMKRIILVSHQESFAAAFPQGYRFEIQNGEARVERMS